MEFVFKDKRNNTDFKKEIKNVSVNITDNIEEKVLNKKEIIEKAKNNLEALGWHVLYMLYLSEEEIQYYKDSNGKNTNIMVPLDKVCTDKFRNCLGEVVDIGPIAYKSMRMGESPWVSIGDTIFIDRYNGRQFMMYGIPFLCMHDEQAMIRVKDPEGFTTF